MLKLICLLICASQVSITMIMFVFPDFQSHGGALSCWFPLVHEPYAYDALILIALCYVYFDAMPLVAMYSCCSIFVSCLQHAIILTLLMYMLLCYKVAFCLDHICLILMPMNLNLNDIWSTLYVNEVHVKFLLIWFL